MTPILRSLWFMLLLCVFASPATSLLLPAESIILKQIHVQFEWDVIPAAVDYQLVVVTDDGSPDPFAGTTPVVDVIFSAATTRRGVTSGLVFGEQYAWRVRGLDGPPFVWEDTHRFETAPLPSQMPIITVTPGTGTPEPGVTLFDIRGASIEGGLAAAVDEAGAPVWFMEWSDTLGDLRFLDNGHVLFFSRDGRGYEMTLGGQIAWASPDDPNLLLHHEVFPMPSGNYLSLAYTWEKVMHEGQMQTWLASRIVEFDASSNVLVFDWDPFDYYSTLDFDPTTLLSPGVGGASFPDL